MNDENELLQAFGRLRATEPDSPGHTAAEIARNSGHNVGWVYARLAELKAAGQLVVGQRIATTISGHPCQKPVYSVAPPKGKRK